jgi:hypothetical protein
MAQARYLLQQVFALLDAALRAGEVQAGLRGEDRGGGRTWTEGRAGERAHRL